jgi:hypothetical protein
MQNFDSGEITTLRLHNPEHVVERQRLSKNFIDKTAELNRDKANDHAAERAIVELVS